jgi:hypothetical protein
MLVITIQILIVFLIVHGVPISTTSTGILNGIIIRNYRELHFYNQTLGKDQIGSVGISVSDFNGYPSEAVFCIFHECSIYALPPVLFENFDLWNVYARDSKIQEILPNTFRNSHQLNSLDLSSNNLTRLAANSFEGASYLWTLSLSDNKISVIDKDAFAGLNFLFNLTLNGNSLTTLDSKTFSHQSYIFYINLSNNRLNALSKSSFSQNLAYRFILYLDGNICVNQTFTFMPFDETAKSQLEAALGTCDKNYQKIPRKICKKIIG